MAILASTVSAGRIRISAPSPGALHRPAIPAWTLAVNTTSSTPTVQDTALAAVPYMLHRSLRPRRFGAGHTSCRRRQQKAEPESRDAGVYREEVPGIVARRVVRRGGERVVRGDGDRVVGHW